MTALGGCRLTTLTGGHHWVVRHLFLRARYDLRPISGIGRQLVPGVQPLLDQRRSRQLADDVDAGDVRLTVATDLRQDGVGGFRGFAREQG